MRPLKMFKRKEKKTKTYARFKRIFLFPYYIFFRRKKREETYSRSARVEQKAIQVHITNHTNECAGIYIYTDTKYQWDVYIFSYIYT